MLIKKQKKNLKITHYHLFLIVLAGITTGTVWATSTFDDDAFDEVDGTVPVEIFGDLSVDGGDVVVEDGAFQFTRDGVQTTMRLINNDKNIAFQFEDPDSSQKYLVRSTTGSNGNFELADFANNQLRIDVSIERSNGNVGIGTNTPSEQLEVKGNIHLSDSDSKITSTGDLCLGSGCPSS